MKALFIVQAKSSCTSFDRFALFVILLLLLAGCGGEPPEPAVADRSDSCDCAPTSGLITDNASDGSKAEVEVDTCMEPRPCNSQSLDVTSYVDGRTRLTRQMEDKLQDKGSVYALLDIKPDGKFWDPAIQITVVLNKPSPRDNFSLSILRWNISGDRWQKEGTAIADKKGDKTAEGEIGHTSLFAFVDEVDETTEGDPQEERVTIPDVVGLPSNEARQRLREEDLDVSLERRSDDDVEEDTVIRTQPRAGGEVDSGTTVTLVVSAGPDESETVRVPDIIGMDGAEAEEMLYDSGLFVSSSRSEESDADEDTVLDTDPPVGSEVEVDSGVFLVLAVPVAVQTVEVPDLIGRPLGQAIDVLSNFDLAVGREIAVESPEPEETIIETDPSPGTEVDIGTAVTLYYAVPEPCEVPDVVGYYLDEATDVLNDTGCLYADQQIGVESSEPEWLVLETDPGPGTHVDPETAVTLYYAEPYTCVVPDLIGSYVDDASSALYDTGCLYEGERIGVESEEYEGIVIDMSPGPGAEVGVDTGVTLYYAIPYYYECVVPYVAGNHLDDAVAAIDETGCLEIGDIFEVEPEYPYTEHQTVRYTEPEGGALVDSGTEVYLYVVVQEIEQDPVTDYNEGCDMGVYAAESLYAFSATILYDNSTFSTDRMQGFIDCYSEMGGEIMNTVPLNSDWYEIMEVSYAAGLWPEVIYFPVQEESANFIADMMTQLNEEYGLETFLFDAYGER